MASSKSPCAITLASLSLLVAGVGVARPAAAANCFEAISEASAKKLFDTFAQAKPSDGCTLENVSTDKSQMTVEWTKGGHLQEAILIVPTSCVKTKPARGKMSMIVPPSVDNACPDAVDATRKLVESETLGDLVPITDGTSLPELDGRSRGLRKKTLGLIGGGLGLAIPVGGGLLALTLQRRKRKRAAAAQPPVKEAESAAATTTAPANAVEPSAPPAEPQPPTEPFDDGAASGPKPRAPMEP